MSLGAAVVEWGALLRLVWTALLAGIGVTGAFAFAILGTTRASEARRAGSGGAAGVYGLLAFAAALAVAAAVVFGVVVMTAKS